MKRIVNGRKEDGEKESEEDSSRDQEIINGNDGEKDPDDSEDEFSAPAAGTRLTDTKSKAVYQVIKAGPAGGTAAFLKPSGSGIKKITIPASIRLGGITYKVTGISADACKNHKMLQSVSVGKNVKTIGDKAFYKCTALPRIIIPEKVSKIGKKAFYGDRKLASIIIRTKKLTNGRTGNGAFDGIGSGAVYTVPRVKAQAYKKLLIAKGADL